MLKTYLLVGFLQEFFFFNYWLKFGGLFIWGLRRLHQLLICLSQHWEHVTMTIKIRYC